MADPDSSLGRLDPETVTVSILIGTHGDDAWSELAWSRAYPSTRGQGALEVLVLHQPAGSVASVRNQLAGQAKGDYLCFLDSDDELCADYVTAMLAAIERAESSWALFAPAVQYVRDGRAVGRPMIPALGRWPDLNQCVIGTLVPRALFHQAGGFRELPSLEDYDLWLRCYIAGAQIVHVPDAVYCAHSAPVSRNADQSTYDRVRRDNIRAWSM